jgi:hypothetical protein
MQRSAGVAGVAGAEHVSDRIARVVRRAMRRSLLMNRIWNSVFATVWDIEQNNDDCNY